MATREDTRRRTLAIFREVFENPSLVITDETMAGDIPAWDSVNHINLILALEEEFEIEFASLEIMALASVGELYALLEIKSETSS